MSNLPWVLEEEILSRTSISSLRAIRSTCKKWNVFSKDEIIGKAARKQFLGLMLIDDKVCSLSFDLHKDDDYVVPSINKVCIPHHRGVHKIFHCDGLMLCVIKDNYGLVVWNPYLGQTRWIEARNDPERGDRYALGYDNNNRNHKILRISKDFSYDDGLRYEMYQFNSGSWRVLDVKPNWHVWSAQRDSVSLKGNTYFFVQGNFYGDEEDEEYEEDEEDEEEGLEESDNFLLCFDFTKESFGPRLLLPFNTYVGETVTLSCVREEQLALLYQSFKTFESIEIWVTNKIDPNAVSWSKFLKLDITPLTGFSVHVMADSFFIDEEKKVAVVFDLHVDNHYQKAHIIGEDGYLKSLNIGRALDLGHFHPLMFSSYVPSLVPLQINQRDKRKTKKLGKRKTKKLGKRKSRDY